MLDLLIISLVMVLGLVYCVCLVVTIIGATHLFVQWVKDRINSLRSDKHE